MMTCRVTCSSHKHYQKLKTVWYWTHTCTDTSLGNIPKIEIYHNTSYITEKHAVSEKVPPKKTTMLDMMNMMNMDKMKTKTDMAPIPANVTPASALPSPTNGRRTSPSTDVTEEANLYRSGSSISKKDPHLLTLITLQLQQTRGDPYLCIWEIIEQMSYDDRVEIVAVNGASSLGDYVEWHLCMPTGINSEWWENFKNSILLSIHEWKAMQYTTVALHQRTGVMTLLLPQANLLLVSSSTTQTTTVKNMKL